MNAAPVASRSDRRDVEHHRGLFDAQASETPTAGFYCRDLWYNSQVSLDPAAFVLPAFSPFHCTLQKPQARCSNFLSRNVSMKLYVGNLSFRTEEQELEALFASVGRVSSVSLVRDRATGQSRGFA